MNSEYIQKRLSYIEALLEYFKNIDMDEELESHAAKYLTVIISGTYEDIIKNTMLTFIHKQTNKKEVSTFVSTQIEFIFRNPTKENTKKFIEKFNKEWMKELNNNIENEKWEALDSIVNNKNLVAHGKSSQITFLGLKEHYENSKGILLELNQTISKE